MSKIEERITEIWDEIIIKERFKTIMAKIDKIEENYDNHRLIIKEELTNLWNMSEIPTFKIILEKLTLIQSYLEKGETSTSKEEEKIIKKEELVDPNVISVNIIGRIKEPVMIDISKSKPRINEEVKKTIGNLADLQKQGRF